VKQYSSIGSLRLDVVDPEIRVSPDDKSNQKYGYKTIGISDTVGEELTIQLFLIVISIS
jgi:hypothetical protein